jgi:hypothetical protein
VNTDPAIYKGNYQHWGTYQPGKRLEPNNMVPPENCAGSNTTQGVLQTDKTTVGAAAGSAAAQAVRVLGDCDCLQGTGSVGTC